MVLCIPKIYPTLPLLSEPESFHLNFLGLSVGDWAGIIFYGFGEQALAVFLVLVASPLSFSEAAVAVPPVKADTWGFRIVTWCLPPWSLSALCIIQEHWYRSMQNTNRAAWIGAREAALPCSYVSFYLRKWNRFAEVSLSTLDKSILLALTWRGSLSWCWVGLEDINWWQGLLAVAKAQTPTAGAGPAPKSCDTKAWTKGTRKREFALGHALLCLSSLGTGTFPAAMSQQENHLCHELSGLSLGPFFPSSSAARASQQCPWSSIPGAATPSKRQEWGTWEEGGHISG